MVEQIRWIDVKEQLPKDGEIICFINAADCVIGGYPIEECMGVGIYHDEVENPDDYNSENVIWTRDGEESIYDFTHWTSLPDLKYDPKEYLEDADKAE